MKTIKLYEDGFSARVKRVVDGDTIEVLILDGVRLDFGFHFVIPVTPQFEMRLRLHGVNTPEISGVKKTSEEFVQGQEAKQFVINWLNRNCSKDINGHWIVHVKTYDGRRLDQNRGKYHGRWVGEVWSKGSDPQSLTEALRRAGHDKLTR